MRVPEHPGGRGGHAAPAGAAPAGAAPAGPPAGPVDRDAVIRALELYRLVVDSIGDYAIVALDPDGVILTWNAGAEQLKGYVAEEIVGRHHSVFYPPEEIAAGRPAHELETALRRGRLETEGWCVRKDGSRFWAASVTIPLRDEAGALVGFAEVMYDLTERRRTEERLRESEERFRVLVQGVKDYAIFMLDPEGRVESWNDGARRIKGYTAEEIIGRHFSTFYPAEDVAAGKTRWELEIAAREGKYEEEGWRVRKDGSYFWASVLITALRDEAGELIGYAKVTRDLTERRAAQERAIADARRIAEAEAESRTKSQFLTAMSHELRTPINATLGYAELVEMGVGGPVTEQQREYLARMRASQEHLLGIINDLLNYSRIEAGQLQYDFAPVSLSAVIDTVIPMVEPQAVMKGLEVVLGPCPEGLVGWADRMKVEQIVLNLLANAVKFTPAGGSITVGCRTLDGNVAITVADTGLGIAPEEQSAIFEPFVQLGRTLTSGHEGTGLGLAISRDLARAMGGELTVESALGEGATFMLVLRPG